MFGPMILVELPKLKMFVGEENFKYESAEKLQNLLYFDHNIEVRGREEFSEGGRGYTSNIYPLDSMIFLHYPKCSHNNVCVHTVLYFYTILIIINVFTLFIYMYEGPSQSNSRSTLCSHICLYL